MQVDNVKPHIFQRNLENAEELVADGQVIWMSKQPTNSPGR